MLSARCATNFYSPDIQAWRHKSVHCSALHLLVPREAAPLGPAHTYLDTMGHWDCYYTPVAEGGKERAAEAADMYRPEGHTQGRNRGIEASASGKCSTRPRTCSRRGRYRQSLCQRSLQWLWHLHRRIPTSSLCRTDTRPNFY